MSKRLNDLDEKYKQAFVYAEAGQNEKAAEEFKKLAEKGHFDAQKTLGHAYSSGVKPFKKNYSKAFYWHKKALAGKEAENYYLLAMLYDPVLYDPNIDEEEFFSFKDKQLSELYYTKAIDAFEKKAKSGDRKSMYRLAEICSAGSTYIPGKSSYWMDRWKTSKNNS